MKQICDHTLLAKDEAKELLNEFKELVSQSQPRKKQKTNGPTAPVEGEPAGQVPVEGELAAPVEGEPAGKYLSRVNPLPLSRVNPLPLPRNPVNPLHLSRADPMPLSRVHPMVMCPQT